MAETLVSDRLVLRPWTLDDADEAFEIYGRHEVARWLSPAMGPVPDVGAMGMVLHHWIVEDERAVAPTGRWAIELQEQKRVIGGVALLYLPPGGEDLEISWHLAPDVWGHGYASEAGHAVAHEALQHHHVEEVFGVVRPENERAAATAQRIGMEWAGETEKYYGQLLQVYRLRAADLDHPMPGQR